MKKPGAHRLRLPVVVPWGDSLALRRCAALAGAVEVAMTRALVGVSNFYNRAGGIAKE